MDSPLESRAADAGARRESARAEQRRDETETERLDRNLAELLQEVRVVQTGVQVMFAFLLTVPFSSRFGEVTSFQRGTYFAALVGAAAASVLLIAPTSLHRLLFRRGEKRYLVQTSHRLAIGGLAFTAQSMIAVMLLVSDVMFGPSAGVAVAVVTTLAFVGVWAVLPLRRRRRNPDGAPGRAAEHDLV